MKYFRTAMALSLILAFAFVGLACPGGDTNHENEEHDDHEEHEEHEEHGEHDDHGHGHGSSQTAGPGMAVVAADEELGIELSPVALERLGVQFTPLSNFRGSDGAREFSVPTMTLVLFEDQAQIFVRDRERIRPYSIRILSRSGDRSRVRVVDPVFANLTESADLVTGEAALVRLAYLEAFGASGSGHGH